MVFVLFDILRWNADYFLNTGENKIVIKKYLEAEPRNPLLCLEKWVNSKHYVKRQVGFCAQWCLDNLCEYGVDVLWWDFCNYFSAVYWSILRRIV
jgi:hypothetical protein